ncbi:GNAT family N-acetyltransferase [Chryseobacterium sp. JUb7]|uniref:GNAT family N-acetyltransferase n=1 Tax=Chryseobacterium sp. JUb7 TaxID=2940599 RepID=UPI0021694169|nr:GNAT family N-acetyltransferase [Chryseobacterium sp. JUb7]MCS3528734.1 GNAT superfamily N-acetyltransferase [Chryseobacterium sp. JUb7]
MHKKVSIEILEKWLTGWSLSRALPLPTSHKTGFKVNVGDEKQKMRYVFSEPDAFFLHLAESIDEPWVFLKVCTCFDDFKDKIPDRWILQPQGYMMSCLGLMKIPDTVCLPRGYTLEFESYPSAFVAKIMTKTGEQAAIGRVVIVDDIAIYDRILTEKEYQRKGLATFLIKQLEKIALSKKVFKNFLIATEEGKMLYEALGWEVYSFYTSIVIPSKI